MKTHRWIILLAAMNAVLLLGLAAQSRPEASQSVLRARAIELVDERGAVRGALIVEENGAAVFRLRDAKGTIRVKLSASEEGSGLVLLDDTTNPGLHVLAKAGKTSMTLTNQDGAKKVVEP